jgi:hypothetical protein
MMLRLARAMFLVVISSLPAAAQPPADVSSQSIGAGAQWAPHTGRGEAPGVQVAWRKWFTLHLGVGTEFRWFQRSTTTDIDFPGQTAPGGIVVPPQQGVEQQRVTSYGFAGAVLARTSIGRVTFIGGAGPGVFVDRTVHDTRINGSLNAGRMTVSSLGLHMVMEMEVRATNRLSAFAGVRMELRDVRDAESSFGYPTAGVRFAF